MAGKHSEESAKIKKLEETIALKDKEIKDIKISVADVLLKIRTINEANNFSACSSKISIKSSYLVSVHNSDIFLVLTSGAE